MGIDLPHIKYSHIILFSVEHLSTDLCCNRPLCNSLLVYKFPIFSQGHDDSFIESLSHIPLGQVIRNSVEVAIHTSGDSLCIIWRLSTMSVHG